MQEKWSYDFIEAFTRLICGAWRLETPQVDEQEQGTQVAGWPPLDLQGYEKATDGPIGRPCNPTGEIIYPTLTVAFLGSPNFW